MPKREQLSELLEYLKAVEEEFVFGGWQEAFQRNFVPVCIVLIFVSGLGSCAFGLANVAMQSETEAAAPDEGNSHNPWSLEKRESSASR